MQGIYTYIPETNRVPREYTVAAILSLLFMVPISPVPALALYYFYVSTFRSMCAVPNMAVFCSSLTSWFPGMLHYYYYYYYYYSSSHNLYHNFQLSCTFVNFTVIHLAGYEAPALYTWKKLKEI
jgi:hypothetical protein